MTPLADPDSDARIHSARLAALIRAEIAGQGGAIAFSRFMELALYAPGLGYYSAGAAKFGPAGDFVTAPELGPLFAACVADALAPVLEEIGPEAQFLEIGGGSGAFAETALKRLLARDALPARYAILEPSADLRQRQQAHLRDHLIPPVFDIVEWLDGPPGEAWRGVVFANEVIDALPTPRFVIGEGGEVLEEYVASHADGGFFVTERPADDMLSAAVRHVEGALDAPLAAGYRSELLPQLPYWLQAVVGPLRRGALLFCDYGYPRAEYYHPSRAHGTVRAFRRHHLVPRVTDWPGLQDITASVDFTALAEAGVHAGFDLAGYATQAAFLIGNGLDARLAEADARAKDEAARLRLRRQAKQLVLPDAMGERFQFMGFERGVAFEHAFTGGDLSWRL
ncbi:class I SAM-dependent methyltransferase [Lysobacter pythonis]|uniref:Class I SAM-dependent methyltransferase n=1 Tax=Solilutibacter pythonis TaxID=2483112 RepID=A0A3M2HMB6_9GAMM|nr:SAM-dependent methyltransferase [Lysobacter pythonis]RMH89033.1 class I SAM-dependent methyltransferase [Lysobacter pythonis]